MKKYFIVFSLLILPFVTHATLFGFLDGKLYDANQNFKYLCFQDNNCIDSNNISYTRNQLGLDNITIAPINNLVTISSTPITFTPEYYSYLAIKNKCDADNQDFIRQEDGLKSTLDNNLYNLQFAFESDAQKNADIIRTNKEYNIALIQIESQRLDKQAKCKIELAKLLNP